MQAHTRASMCKPARASPHESKHMQAHTRASMRKPARASTCKHTRENTCKHTREQACVSPHERAYASTHERTHARTRMIQKHAQECIDLCLVLWRYLITFLKRIIHHISATALREGGRPYICHTQESNLNRWQYTNHTLL